MKSTRHVLTEKFNNKTAIENFMLNFFENYTTEWRNIDEDNTVFYHSHEGTVFIRFEDKNDYWVSEDIIWSPLRKKYGMENTDVYDLIRHYILIRVRPKYRNFRIHSDYIQWLNNTTNKRYNVYNQ